MFINDYVCKTCHDSMINGIINNIISSFVLLLLNVCYIKGHEEGLWVCLMLRKIFGPMLINEGWRIRKSKALRGKHPNMGPLAKSPRLRWAECVEYHCKKCMPRNTRWQKTTWQVKNTVEISSNDRHITRLGTKLKASEDGRE